jgi:hypothetical protein
MFYWINIYIYIYWHKAITVNIYILINNKHYVLICCSLPRLKNNVKIMSISHMYLRETGTKEKT